MRSLDSSCSSLTSIALLTILGIRLRSVALLTKHVVFIGLDHRSLAQTRLAVTAGPHFPHEERAPPPTTLARLPAFPYEPLFVLPSHRFPQVRHDGLLSFLRLPRKIRCVKFGGPDPIRTGDLLIAKK